MRVLAIDDDKDILDLIEVYLRAGGHEVQATTEAKVAVALLDSETFDAVVTDVLLPEIDGIEIMRLVRGSHPDMWVVAISGGTSRFPANAALKLTQIFGANRVLYKPFSQEELLAALDRKNDLPLSR